MNFYKRHIGDYLKDTAHLSLLEHGVYTRLLDVYYTRESGIPDDQAARLIGARGREEVAALKIVLGEFFELIDGTWIQDRCEREINATGSKPDEEEGAPAKSGKARRQQEYRERRAMLFEALRERGITMPFKATMNELQDALLNVTKSPHVMPPVTDNVTERVTDDMHNVTATNSQTPDSRLQTPDLTPQGSAHATAEPSRARRDLRVTESDSQIRDVRPVDISSAMRRHSIESQPGDPRIQTAIDAGVTVETVEAACVSAKSKKQGQRIAAAYVLTIAEAWTAEAATPRKPSSSPQRMSREDERRAISERNARAFLSGEDPDPNVIDMEVSHAGR